MFCQVNYRHPFLLFISCNDLLLSSFFCYAFNHSGKSIVENILFCHILSVWDDTYPFMFFSPRLKRKNTKGKGKVFLCKGFSTRSTCNGETEWGMAFHNILEVKITQPANKDSKQIAQEIDTPYPENGSPQRRRRCKHRPVNLPPSLSLYVLAE